MHFIELELRREEAACFKCEAVFCCSGPGLSRWKSPRTILIVCTVCKFFLLLMRAFVVERISSATSTGLSQGSSAAPVCRHAAIGSCTGPIIGHNNRSRWASKYGRGQRRVQQVSADLRGLLVLAMSCNSMMSIPCL